MSPSSIPIILATEEDAPTLASIMTAAFSASDAAYPLIWGSAPEGTHDMISVKGLFTPVQKEGRVTFKAVNTEDKIVGFVTWSLPKERKPDDGSKGKEGSGGMPDLPGVNMGLWMEKLGGPKKLFERDVDKEKDMRASFIILSSIFMELTTLLVLSFFFVHPDHQRQGIGSSMLKWGKEKADASGIKIWLTSTPQARPVYEQNGWKVVDTCTTDLEPHGGQGTYTRAWMLRVGGTEN